jgi:preprotein translocase subunit SecE
LSSPETFEEGRKGATSKSRHAESFHDGGNVATEMMEYVISRWTRLKAFFTDVRLEMKKVSWPSRKEITGTTVVVLFAVFFFGFYLGFLDFGFGKLVQKIFHFFRTT